MRGTECNVWAQGHAPERKRAGNDQAEGDDENVQSHEEATGSGGKALGVQGSGQSPQVGLCGNFSAWGCIEKVASLASTNNLSLFVGWGRPWW